MTQRRWTTLLLPFIAAACSHTTIPEEGTKAGSLSLSLTGVDPHGTSYRLSSAEFEVTGCPDYYPSNVAGSGGNAGGGGQGESSCVDLVLSSDDNPEAAVITQRLLPGYYNVQLLDGWTLEQLTAAGPIPVEKALLLSPNYQYAYVWDGGVSQVVYAFGVGGDLIDFRHGDLAISISVEQPGDHGCSTGAGGGGFAGGVSCPPIGGAAGGISAPAGFGGVSGAAGVGFCGLCTVSRAKHSRATPCLDLAGGCIARTTPYLYCVAMRMILRGRLSSCLLLLSLLTSSAACSKSAARPAKATAKKGSASPPESDASPLAPDASPLAPDASQPLSDASQLERDAAVGASPSPIWLENMRSGVAHENPDQPAGSEVAGYSSVVSAAPGTTLQLFVNVDHDQNVRWNLYRVGYYGGLGTRLIARGEPRPVAVQPQCPTDADTGLIECSWAAAFEVTIDPTWVSGYYFFELVNDDGFGSRVPLIVREGERHAEALVEASVNTWQAYNRWGGISLYGNDHRDGPYTQGNGHRVSFDRPYAGQNELPPFLDMIRFLEQRGYDLSYTTNVDVDADADMLTGRKLFMTVAHGEYWTVAERDAIEVARGQGVSLGFFSANTGYWRVRLDPSSSGNPRRIVTCYKSALTDPVQNARDTTGMFRNPPYARPENALIGVGYRTWSKVPGYPYIVTNPEHWVYEGTGVKSYDALSNVVGSEWDGVTDNGKTPDGLEVVARAITIDNDGAFIEGEANATVYYPTPTSFVFAGGSISWGFGLGQGPFADARVERMTENVLARAGLVSALPLTEPAEARAPVASFESKVLAGNGDVSQNDGPALQASFVAPTGITAGLDGKLYIIDRGDHVIRVLARDGTLSSMVDFDTAVFARPMGLAVDSKGTLYLSDSRKNRIFKLSSDGTVTPYAGAGPSGAADASDPLSATFFGPRGIAIGPDDELYVADNMNNAIRRIDSAGVTTVATDLRFVSAVAAGADGAVYFSTIVNGQIGVVRHGQVTILANVAGQAGNQEGPAALARLQPGEGLLVDGDRLLFADTENNRVRALTLTDPPLISTVFGDGNATADMHDAKHTWLPRGIVRFDGGYAVSDFGSHRVLWFKEAKPKP